MSGTVLANASHPRAALHSLPGCAAPFLSPKPRSDIDERHHKQAEQGNKAPAKRVVEVSERKREQRARCLIEIGEGGHKTQKRADKSEDGQDEANGAPEGWPWLLHNVSPFLLRFFIPHSTPLAQEAVSPHSIVRSFSANFFIFPCHIIVLRIQLSVYHCEFRNHVLCCGWLY